MNNASKNYLDDKSLVLFNITKKDNLFLNTKNIKYYFNYIGNKKFKYLLYSIKFFGYSSYKRA